MVGNGARANLRSLAVPLAGCRERLCEFFCWLTVLGAVANGRKRSLRYFTFARCAIGRLPRTLA